jgi:hypothetical protein
MVLRVDYQTPFSGLGQIKTAIEAMAGAGSESRGGVFTRRELIEFILFAGHLAAEAAR